VTSKTTISFRISALDIVRTFPRRASLCPSTCVCVWLLVASGKQKSRRHFKAESQNSSFPSDIILLKNFTFGKLNFLCLIKHRVVCKWRCTSTSSFPALCGGVLWDARPVPRVSGERILVAVGQEAGLVPQPVYSGADNSVFQPVFETRTPSVQLVASHWTPVRSWLSSVRFARFKTFQRLSFPICKHVTWSAHKSRNSRDDRATSMGLC